MLLPQPLDQALYHFRLFLSAQKLTPKTSRNYLSDVNQFLTWAKVDSLLALTSSLLAEYVAHLKNRNIPLSTLTRHLASLRQFGAFLETIYSLPNPVANLLNPELPLIPTVLKNFRSHLVKNRYKSKTVANYLSDVRHYLAWAEAKLDAKR